MQIYPAIDILGGQCVRLHKGDFAQKTVYDTSPLGVATSYYEVGAQWVHVVDLDGARDPEQRQKAIITSLVKNSGLKVQTGGGIRSLRDVDTLLGLGAARVVIGSMAVQEPDKMHECLKMFRAENICLAVDVAISGNDYYVATSGWTKTSEHRLMDVLDQFVGEGLKYILCTDISRDGTLGGANIALYSQLKEHFPTLYIEASGGIHSLEDLRHLADVGVDAAIIGKALYEGVFTLQEALKIV